MSLCLSAAGVTVALAMTQFTLVWTHSVEQTEWRERWSVRPKALVLEQAMVKGSGAGIDPPPESRLEDGFWTWRAQKRLKRLVLNDSGFGSGWKICSEETCVAAAAIVPGRGQTLVLESCAAEGVPLSAFRPSDVTEPQNDE